MLAFQATTAFIEPLFLLVCAGMSARLLAGFSVALNAYNGGGGSASFGGLGSLGNSGGGFGGSGGTSSSRRGSSGGKYTPTDPFYTFRITSDGKTYQRAYSVEPRKTTYTIVPSGFVIDATATETDLGFQYGYTTTVRTTLDSDAVYSIFTGGYESFNIPWQQGGSTLTTSTYSYFSTSIAYYSQLPRRDVQPTPCSAQGQVAKRGLVMPTPAPRAHRSTKDEEPKLERRIILPKSFDEIKARVSAMVALYALLLVALLTRLIMIPVYLIKHQRQQSNGNQHGLAKCARSFFIATIAITAILAVFGLVTFAVQGAFFGAQSPFVGTAIAFWIVSILLGACSAFLLHSAYVQARRKADDDDRDVGEEKQAAYAEQAASPAQASSPPSVPTQEQGRPAEAIAPGTMFVSVSDGQGGVRMMPVRQ